MSLATYQAVQGMVYSPKLLSRAGVPLPRQGWTWTDFKDAAQRASKPPETWGLSFAWIMHHLLSWMGTMGASYVSADKRRMTVSSPEVQEAAEFVLGLIRGNVTSATENRELFRKGTDEAVFEQTGPFRMPTFRQNGITDFGVVHHPVHPQKRVVAGYADGSEVWSSRAPRRNDSRRRAGGVVPQRPLRPGPAVRAGDDGAGEQGGGERQGAAGAPQDRPPAQGLRRRRLPGAFGALPVPAVLPEDRQRDAHPRVADIFAQKVSVRDGLAGNQQRAQVLLDEDLKAGA